MKRQATFLWALYDKDGEIAGTYDLYKDACDDAVGPRFGSFAVVKYRRCPGKPAKQHKGGPR